MAWRRRASQIHNKDSVELTSLVDTSPPLKYMRWDLLPYTQNAADLMCLQDIYFFAVVCIDAPDLSSLLVSQRITRIAWGGSTLITRLKCSAKERQGRILASTPFPRAFISYLGTSSVFLSILISRSVPSLSFLFPTPPHSELLLAGPETEDVPLPDSPLQ